MWTRWWGSGSSSLTQISSRIAVKADELDVSMHQQAAGFMFIYLMMFSFQGQ